MAGAPPVVTNQRPGPADVFRTLGTKNLYNEAKERKVSLSSHLESLHPESEYKDGLDAFSRLMAVANIKTQSDYRGGYQADDMDAFSRDENSRALFPEWAWRQWRKASQAVYQRAPLLSADQGGLGTVARPYADSLVPRAPQLQAAIPLEEVVAMTAVIDTDSYRAFYMTDNAAQTRLVRVSEAAELPRATVAGTERTINLYKYGRLLEFSYEFVRRRRIDLIAFWIQRLAIQTEKDKVVAVLDVAINGDGGASTAATNTNLSTLDPTTPLGTLSLKAWLGFKLLWTNPYQLTHVFARSTEALQIYSLNVGSANVPLVTIQGQSGFGSIIPINRELADNVRIGITSDAPANVIVGMDTRFGIERVVEAGSDISEQDRWIHNQVNILTFSENEGYDVQDQLATKTLTLNA